MFFTIEFSCGFKCLVFNFVCTFILKKLLGSGSGSVFSSKRIKKMKIEIRVDSDSIKFFL